MKGFFRLLLLQVVIVVNAQTVYRTGSFYPTVKTLQVGIQSQKFSIPVILLNGNERIQISFDEMSHESHSFGYTVYHCNADWTKSNLNSNEFLSGYTTANITDVATSVNTTFLYTHYSFALPNDDMSFKISGNYVIVIYEDNLVEKPVAYACFSVVDPKVRVEASIRGNTDTELSAKSQQLDFSVDYTGYPLRDPSEEIKIVVRQNNRLDNEVKNLKPTYLSAGKLSYVNNPALIFEGGSEYHRFDISGVYAAGEGVEGIRFEQPYYHAFLINNKIQANRAYVQDVDVNGKYVVNLQNSDEDDIEADYMYVHFTLPVSSPFFDGQLFVGGEFLNNQMNNTNRMLYSSTTGAYTQSILLKQGGYNYQYWFVPKGKSAATTERVDGSYWQTRNDYIIYVYQRPWGERYDKLISVKEVNQ